MSKLPLDLFLPPKQKREPRIEYCFDCFHWQKWTNKCGLGYTSKAGSKKCNQVMPKRC